MRMLSQLVRQILLRDVFYVAGGGLILTFVLQNSQWANSTFIEPGWFSVFLIVVFAYCFGFANMVLWEYVGVITTVVPPHGPTGVVRWLFRRYHRRHWYSEDELPPATLRASSTRRERDDLLERTVNLKHVSVALGCSLLTCTVIAILGKLFGSKMPVPWTFVLAVFFVGLLLIAQAWVKAFELFYLNKWLLENPLKEKVKRKSTKAVAPQVEG